MLKEKIKLYRESKNMTQVEIAELLGVKPATISKYEAGTLEANMELLNNYKWNNRISCKVWKDTSVSRW